MRRLLSVAAAVSLIAFPASAGIRDEFEQQDNKHQAMLRRCNEIKANATHSGINPFDVWRTFYRVSGNLIEVCSMSNAGVMKVKEYSLRTIYSLSPRQDAEYHLENKELVLYVKVRGSRRVERQTHIKRTGVLSLERLGITPDMLVPNFKETP